MVSLSKNMLEDDEWIHSDDKEKELSQNRTTAKKCPLNTLGTIHEVQEALETWKSFVLFKETEGHFNENILGFQAYFGKLDS